MWQFTFFIFFILFCIFAGIMAREPRTLWSGVSFFFMMICLSISLFFILSEYSRWLAAHDVVIGILILLFVLAIGCMLMFPAALIVMFFIEGIKVIKHEGVKPSNLLSMLFSILLYVYLSVCLADDWQFKKKYIKYNALCYHQFFGSICIIIDGYVFTFCNS